MKKQLFVFAAALGLTTVALAQETKTFKPEADDYSIEVTFDPGTIFGAKQVSTFSLPSIGTTLNGNLNPGIKVRKWKDNQTAYRATVLVGFNAQNTPKTDPIETTYFNSNGEAVVVDDLKNSRSEWAIQLRPGIEKHFEGTQRFSPYVGLEAILALGGNSQTEETLTGADDGSRDIKKIKNDATSSISLPGIPQGNQFNYLTGFTIGAGAIAGFDFYVAKDLYIGLELSYAIAYNAAGKRKEIDTPATGDETTIETKGGYTFMFDPSTAAGGAFKLGWNF